MPGGPELVVYFDETAPMKFEMRGDESNKYDDMYVHEDDDEEEDENESNDSEDDD